MPEGSEQPPIDKPGESPAQAVPREPDPPKIVPVVPRVERGFFSEMFRLRRPQSLVQTLVFGMLCILSVFAVWWYVTYGEEPEQRILGPMALPSPSETFSEFETLWYRRELTRNTYASLRRVALGFALATIIGVPAGVLAGCFSWFRAFVAPLSIFGRNIPIAALIPLTFSVLGIGEIQKIMFIFIACVAFILSDSTRAISDVSERYIDTAYTLGAKRYQVILKVLVPLAMPTIFDSLRLLFGLAFGYIMLAEIVKLGGESGGLGDIIIISQRLGDREPILLVLLIIPLVALGIDRTLFWIQRQLFPYRYGSMGILHRAVRAAMHVWGDVKGVFFKPGEAALSAVMNENTSPDSDKTS
jgi:NitT/TauT family transport system permease protein